MENNTPSTIGQLNKHDLINAVIIFAGTVILTYVQSKIPEWNISPELKIGLSSFVTYLLKNVFTNNIKIAQKVLIKATQKADTIEQEKALIHPILEVSSLPVSEDLKKK